VVTEERARESDVQAEDPSLIRSILEQIALCEAR
jgi:hypothetical protein